MNRTSVEVVDKQNVHNLSMKEAVFFGQLVKEVFILSLETKQVEARDAKVISAMQKACFV